MDGNKKMEQCFSQWCPVTGQEAMGTNWNTGNSIKILKKSFFTVRMVKHWIVLPREVVLYPSLEIVKTHLDTEQPALTDPVISRDIGLVVSSNCDFVTLRNIKCYKLVLCQMGIE